MTSKNPKKLWLRYIIGIILWSLFILTWTITIFSETLVAISLILSWILMLPFFHEFINKKLNIEISFWLNLTLIIIILIIWWYLWILSQNEEIDVVIEAQNYPDKETQIYEAVIEADARAAREAESKYPTSIDNPLLRDWNTYKEELALENMELYWMYERINCKV